MLNLSHLRAFVVVAEELNFRKAALKLNLTQPPLTRQIRLLEEELGVTLFIRDRHAVHLSGAGKVLLEQARALLSHASQIETTLKQRSAGNSGIVNVGLALNLADIIYDVSVHHLKHYPKVNIVHLEMPSSSQCWALQRGEIDVGFIRPPVCAHNVVSEPLYSDSFSVILPKDHPLAQKESIRLKQLANEKLLMFTRGNSEGVHDKILSMFHNAKMTPEVIYTGLSPYNAGVVDVLSGKGIYVVHSSNVPLRNPRVAFVHLDEPDATMEVHMAWRAGLTSTRILRYLDSARAILKKQ